MIESTYRKKIGKTENNKLQSLIYDLTKDTCKASKQKINSSDATKINVEEIRSRK